MKKKIADMTPEELAARNKRLEINRLRREKLVEQYRAAQAQQNEWKKPLVELPQDKVPEAIKILQQRQHDAFIATITGLADQLTAELHRAGYGEQCSYYKTNAAGSIVHTLRKVKGMENYLGKVFK